MSHSCTGWEKVEGIWYDPWRWSHSANSPTLHPPLRPWAKFFWLLPPCFCYWSYHCIWSSLNLSFFKTHERKLYTIFRINEVEIINSSVSFPEQLRSIHLYNAIAIFTSGSLQLPCKCQVHTTFFDSALSSRLRLSFKHNFLLLTMYKNLYFVTLIFISLLLCQALRF